MTNPTVELTLPVMQDMELAATKLQKLSQNVWIWMKKKLTRSVWP